MITVREYLYNKIKDICNVYYDEPAGEATYPVCIYKMPNIIDGAIKGTDQVVLELEIYDEIDPVNPDKAISNVESIAMQLDMVLDDLKFISDSLTGRIMHANPFWINLPDAEGIKGIKLQYLVRLFNRYYN